MRSLFERNDGVYDGDELVIPRRAFRKTGVQGVDFVSRGQSLRFWNVDHLALMRGDDYIYTYHLRLDNETSGRTVCDVRVTPTDAELLFAGIGEPRRTQRETRVRLCDGETVRMERIEAWRDSEIRKGILATFTTDLPPLAAEAAVLLLELWPPAPWLEYKGDPLPPRRNIGL
ncbi:hypothetical protein EON79_08180 [bacterium]|nr:MAG: hypothetical protein EON79_08180 [bacterium]